MYTVLWKHLLFPVSVSFIGSSRLGADGVSTLCFRIQVIYAFAVGFVQALRILVTLVQ
jgi:hypothetical protein